jgi:hypothetical protein
MLYLKMAKAVVLLNSLKICSQISLPAEISVILSVKLSTAENNLLKKNLKKYFIMFLNVQKSEVVSKLIKRIKAL